MSTLASIYKGLRHRGRKNTTMNDNDTNKDDGKAKSSGGATEKPVGFWESFDFSSLLEDEYGSVMDAAIKIQSFYRMHLAKIEVAAMPKLIHEWKVVSKEELLGELSFGKYIRIKVEPYFPLPGEKVTCV